MLQGRYTTRRRTVLLGTAASIALLTAGKVAQMPFALAQTAEKPRFFSAEELAFVTVMVDRLIPSDEVGPGAVELGVPYFIDTQLMTEYGAGGIWYMAGPFVPSSAPEFGYQLPFTPQQIYRQGIPAAAAAIKNKFGKALQGLVASDQDAALLALQKGQLDMSPVPAPAFFSQVLNDTKQGYFADPIYGGNKDMGAWKMIGFPGARASYLDWTDRDEKYPFPPVSITDLGGQPA
jgi:gluconate 2-dehydrogenase gamma chain